MAAYPFGDEEHGIDIKRLFQAHIEVSYWFVFYSPNICYAYLGKRAIYKIIFPIAQDAVRWQSIYLSPNSSEHLVKKSLDSSSDLWMVLFQSFKRPIQHFILKIFQIILIQGFSMYKRTRNSYKNTIGERKRRKHW